MAKKSSCPITREGFRQNAKALAVKVGDKEFTAVVKEFLLNTERQQHSQLRRMAQRLSLFTNLAKYVLEDPPRWRTHGGAFLYANAYNDALIFGDAGGAAYVELTHRLLSATQSLSRLPADARRSLLARLATIELTDAAAIAATHDSGQLRLNGRRRELQAIDALETHVIDPSNEQSATAVLDKISGAVVIAARQRQARAQLLAGIVEQLLVEGKRARDAGVAAAVLGHAMHDLHRAARRTVGSPGPHQCLQAAADPVLELRGLHGVSSPIPART